MPCFPRWDDALKCLVPDPAASLAASPTRLLRCSGHHANRRKEFSDAPDESRSLGRLETGPRWDTSYRELNVIGQRAEEALSEVDKFLDSAALASVNRVRIIHGHGMGGPRWNASLALIIRGGCRVTCWSSCVDLQLAY